MIQHLWKVVCERHCLSQDLRLWWFEKGAYNQGLPSRRPWDTWLFCLLIIFLILVIMLGELEVDNVCQRTSSDLTSGLLKGIECLCIYSLVFGHENEKEIFTQWQYLLRTFDCLHFDTLAGI